MATIAEGAVAGRPSLRVDRFERLLAGGAALLLTAVALALVKGQADWGRIPAIVWLHLATILTALALTPPMLLRPRGDARHRLFGRIWVAAMIATAVLSFGIRSGGSYGGFSVIHLLSAFVLAMAPYAWWTARTHRVAAHRRAVRGLVTGALIVAGVFTFPFGRLLGGWLFG